MLTAIGPLKQNVLGNKVLFLSPKVKRLLFVYERYKKIGTMAGVGREVGLTRERVRQLIRKGTELGLFENQKPVRTAYLAISREAVIDDYRNLLQFKLVAEKNNITLYQFYHLLKIYRITREEIEKVRCQGHQLKSILQYFSFVRAKGGHLSTTELQKSPAGRYLSGKITRFWGSIHAFRKELKIPFRIP